MRDEGRAMSKVKVRTQSRTLHAALRDAGMKRKKAAKIANTFDAWFTPGELKKQRKKAGRKGGKATARKQKAIAKKSRSGGKKKSSAGGNKKRSSARKRS
jgi:hypothetical protein